MCCLLGNFPEKQPTQKDNARCDEENEDIYTKIYIYMMFGFFWGLETKGFFYDENDYDDDDDVDDSLRIVPRTHHMQYV